MQLAMMERSGEVLEKGSKDWDWKGEGFLVFLGKAGGLERGKLFCVVFFGENNTFFFFPGETK